MYTAGTPCSSMPMVTGRRGARAHIAESDDRGFRTRSLDEVGPVVFELPRRLAAHGLFQLDEAETELTLIARFTVPEEMQRKQFEEDAFRKIAERSVSQLFESVLSGL